MGVSRPDNPLHGKPPAPDQVRDAEPEGKSPNASTHFDNRPEWKKRPEQYPAAKEGLQNTDIPGKGK